MENKVKVSCNNCAMYYLPPDEEPCRHCFSYDEWVLSDAINNMSTKHSAVEAAQSDAVNSPNHYNHSKVEAIAAIEASMSPLEFAGYLKGNILKYLWRYRYKNGLEDINKAAWYTQRLSKHLETNPGILSKEDI